MLLSPQEPLIAGGPAEELERRIQEIFKAGYEHVVIDLRGVPTADSAGIRALVRGHTSAQRLNRRFTLVSPNPRVRELLELSLLTRVLEVVDSLVEAKTRTIPWDRVWTGVAVAFVGARARRRRRQVAGSRLDAAARRCPARFTERPGGGRDATRHPSRIRSSSWRS